MTRWRMAKSPDWLRAELGKAAGYKDTEQRLAARLVTAYLDGEAENLMEVGWALWTLGGPIQYAIEWRAGEVSA